MIRTAGVRLVRRIRTAALLAAVCLPGALSAAPSECVPSKNCQPPPLSDFRTISIAYGSELKQEWIDQYAPMLIERFGDSCKRLGRCFTVWGNSPDFCRDNLKSDLFAECDALFDRTTAQNDATSCHVFADVYALGQAKAGRQIWELAQKCARAKAESAGPLTHMPSPRVAVEPNAPKPDKDSTVIVRSFDEDGDPVMALVKIAGIERGYTFLPMRYGFSFERSWDDEGRATLSAPSVVVYSPPAKKGDPPPFDPVTVAFETKPATVRLEITPPVEKWKSGANKVRVVAFDSVTGSEVRGKLKTVGSILGPSGSSIEIRLEKGSPHCGAPIWFAAEKSWYAEADLGVPRCAGPRVP